MTSSTLPKASCEIGNAFLPKASCEIGNAFCFVLEPPFGTAATRPRVTGGMLVAVGGRG